MSKVNNIERWKLLGERQLFEIESPKSLIAILYLLTYKAENNGLGNERLKAFLSSIISNHGFLVAIIENAPSYKVLVAFLELMVESSPNDSIGSNFIKGISDLVIKLREDGEEIDIAYTVLDELYKKADELKNRYIIKLFMNFKTPVVPYGAIIKKYLKMRDFPYLSELIKYYWQVRMKELIDRTYLANREIKFPISHFAKIIDYLHYPEIVEDDRTTNKEFNAYVNLLSIYYLEQSKMITHMRKVRTHFNRQ